MNEYAVLLASGEVQHLVTTGRTLDEVKKSFPDHKVVLVSDVPLSVLERYQYWSNRP